MTAKKAEDKKKLAEKERLLKTREFAAK